MDKSEITSRIRDCKYTHIVKFYQDGVSRIIPLCTVDGVLPIDYIEEELHLKQNEYKVVFEIGNEFGLDDYLSDNIIDWLDPYGSTYTNESSLTDNEVAKYVAAYIDYLYNYCGWGDNKDKETLKRETLLSIVKYMDLRKKHPMTIPIIVEILNFFNIAYDTSLNLRTQIEQVLNSTTTDILNQLAKPDFAKILRRHLDKIGEAYKIIEEKSQYRIGILYLKMFYAFSKSGFLQSKHIKEDGSIRNYTRYMQLMTNYYGLNSVPTYREGVLKRYREKGAKNTLYATIKGEHYDVWLSLP